MTTAAPLPTLDDIRAAREALDGVSIYTPMEGSRWLSAIAGGPVLIKAENLQRTGSFKIRGAYLRMSRLSEEEKALGVVAASAGNHAQGVALAAQMLGIKATVFMPQGAPIPKERATRGYGADVRFHGITIDEALLAAQEFADETGAVLIHPFDHVDIVTGQGTCGLEILEQCPEVRDGRRTHRRRRLHRRHRDRGQGGSAPTCAWSACRRRAPPPTRPRSREGKPVALETMTTMADGIAVGCPGDIPFRAIQQHVDEVRTVSEESMSRALLMLLERAKLVVEPAGAAAVAALLDEPKAFATPTVVVLSGGNIDPLLMMRVIRHGMAAAGRYLYFRATIPDVPGGLARLLNELAEVEANVLDVVHERTSASLHLDEVEVQLQLETRGEEHARRVLDHLADCGYVVTQ